MLSNSLVSVVVTTKNEEKNIENCLKSINNQTYKNIEVILVDNSSTDRTKEIGQTLGAQVYNYGPERSAQRNYGMIEAAKGKYVMYVDADMLMSPTLISECVNHIGNASEIVGLYIPERILGRSLFCKIRRFERPFYDGTPIDAGRFFRREAFILAGGFDTELFRVGSGEDWDLDKKINKFGSIELLTAKAEQDPDNSWVHQFARDRGVTIGNEVALLHDESDDKLVAYLQKKQYYATGFKGYIDKWGKSDPDIRKQFGFVYRFLIVFLEKGKWVKALSRIDLFALTILLKITIGLVTFRKWHKW